MRALIPQVHCYLGWLSALASVVFLAGCGAPSADQAQGGNDSLAITTTDPVAGPLYQKYRALPYRASGFYRYEWEEYGRCLPNEAKEIFWGTAQTMGVDVYDLFTVAMGEGLGFFFDKTTLRGGPDDVSSKEALLGVPVNGYGYLGVDFFLSNLPSLISSGLLPPDFQEGRAFTTFSVERNEPADNGTPIVIRVPLFVNLEKAILGFGALYAQRVRMAESQARTLGLGTLNRDQNTFWGYYFYQNPGIAADAMRNSGLGILSSKPDEDRPWDIRRKSLKRVVTSRYFEGYKILESSAQASCNGPIW